MVLHFIYTLGTEVWIDGYSGRREAMSQILYYFRHNILGYQINLKQYIIVPGKTNSCLTKIKDFFHKNCGNPRFPCSATVGTQ